MSNLLKRISAYFIDAVIVYLIVYLITSIPFVNFELDSYNAEQQKYGDAYTEYMDFTSDLKEFYDDGKITLNEYDKLKKNNSASYIKVLDKYYKDNKLTKSNYDKLLDKVYDDFKKIYKDSYYKINKYSTMYNIVYIVVLILYFVGFNVWTDGQTFGKKIFGLRIVNNKDSKKLTWVNYLIRTFVLYNLFYYFALLLGPYFLDVDGFYNWGYVWGNIRNYLEIFILVMIIFRVDNRGIHDLLAGTKVISGDSFVKANEDCDVIKKSDNKDSVKKRKKNAKIIVDEE